MATEERRAEGRDEGCSLPAARCLSSTIPLLPPTQSTQSTHTDPHPPTFVAHHPRHLYQRYDCIASHSIPSHSSSHSSPPIPDTMASTSTDPLERAVLSGALFAGPDPEGREPDRSRDDDDDDYTLDDDDGDDVDGAPSDTDIGFVPPSEAAAASSSGAGQLARATTSRRGQSHNTGVKGVLADYRASKQQQQHKQPSRTTASQSITSRLPKDVHNGVEGISLSDAAADDDDLDSSEGEREAKERYRRQRMAEMMKMGSGERRDVIIASKATGGLSHSTKRVNGEERGTATAAAGRIRHGGLGRFGHLREVGQHQFVHATEEAEGVTVVVHVYDPVSVWD